MKKDWKVALALLLVVCVSCMCFTAAFAYSRKDVQLCPPDTQIEKLPTGWLKLTGQCEKVNQGKNSPGIQKPPERESAPEFWDEAYFKLCGDPSKPRHAFCYEGFWDSYYNGR